jgi:hypothetical protein
MDSYHRQRRRKEQPSGKDCQFCAALDSNFAMHDPMDRWVEGSPQDSAFAHVSENGPLFCTCSMKIEKNRTLGHPGTRFW